MTVEKIILVDEADNVIGGEEKFTCHIRTPAFPTGKLHRAFSLFIYSYDCEKLLLQQRAQGKHTFPLRWTNSVCSHPNFNIVESSGIEGVIKAAKRRAYEELGIILDEHKMVPICRFIYDAVSCERYAEYELDYIIFTKFDDIAAMNVNKEEVMSIKWVTQDQLNSVPNKSPWLLKMNDCGILNEYWSKFKRGQIEFVDQIFRV